MRLFNIIQQNDLPKTMSIYLELGYFSDTFVCDIPGQCTRGRHASQAWCLVLTGNDISKYRRNLCQINRIHR